MVGWVHHSGGRPVEELPIVINDHQTTLSEQGAFSFALADLQAGDPIQLEVEGKVVLSPYSLRPGRWFIPKGPLTAIRVAIAEVGQDGLLDDDDFVRGILQELLFPLSRSTDLTDALLDAGIFEKAEDLGLSYQDLKNRLDQWGSSGASSYDRALGALMQKRYSEAVLLLRRAAPGLERWLAQAAAHFHLSDLGASLQALQEAVLIRPRDPVALSNLGIVHGRLGNHDRAVAFLSQALEIRSRILAAGSFEIVENSLALSEAHRLDGANDLADQILSSALSVPSALPGTILIPHLDWTIRYNYAADILERLPFGGVRPFDVPALLSPGVFRVPESSGTGPAVGIGVGAPGQFSVNGQRGRSNNFTLDGSDNNDEDIGMRRQGFEALSPQGLDSVGEVQIITAGFQSEFGRNSGSIVNMISKSGTIKTTQRPGAQGTTLPQAAPTPTTSRRKTWHGNLFGIFTDDFLNARDYFETPFADRVNPAMPGTATLNGGSFPKSSSTQVIYGGTLGGQLIEKKLFLFFSGEQYRRRRLEIGHFVVPAPEERGLRAFDPDDRVAITIPEDELDNFLSRFNHSGFAGQEIFRLYPLPNNPLGPFGANNYSQSVRGEGTGSVASAKADWHLDAVHTLTGRYNFTDDRVILPFTGQAIRSSLGADTRTQNLSLYFDSHFSDFSNQFRFSYGRTALSFPPERGSVLLFGSPLSDEFIMEAQRLSEDFQIPTTPISTSFGVFGPFGATGPIGQLWIDPFSSIGLDVFNFPQGRVDNTFQFANLSSLTLNDHLLKFGFDVRRSQLNSFSDRNSRPLVRFNFGLVDENGCNFDNNCPFATLDGLLRGTDTASLGAPGGFLQSLSTGSLPDTTIGLRLTQFDFFIQDDWRIADHFTINLGLRYELQTAPSEVNGRIENTFVADPAQFSRLPPTGPFAADIQAANQAFDEAFDGLRQFLAGRQKIYDSFKTGFSPRIGFAWDPFKRRRTSLRGGFALLYDANLGAVTSQSRNVFPTFVPINLDPAFAQPSGIILNSPVFFNFRPLDLPLIRPGTLNTYNLAETAFATGLGSLFQQTTTLVGDSSANGLAFTLPERRLRTPYAMQAALSLEQQLGSKLIFSAAYVGTQGRRLTGFATPNAGLFTTPVAFIDIPRAGDLLVSSLPPSIPAVGARRPDPRLGAISVFQNSFNSSYHSLQLSLRNRRWKGLQSQLQWTWSHAIDQLSDPFDGKGFFALPQDSTRPDLEKASANFDIRHRLTGYFVWSPDDRLPWKWLNGWALSGKLEFSTAQPFTVNTALDRNGDGNLTDRLDSLSGIATFAGSPSPIRVSQSDLLRLVAERNQVGRVGRNTFRSDSFALIDLSVSRSFHLKDELGLEFRVEVFNALNRTHFGIPIRILESPGFGRSYDTSADARTVRVGLRLDF